ncbi:AraC family transcriptional regulator [Tropicibacter naphthalenivorans]|uniref:HTH-type transcriptional regulator YesS n=1 Tax=Tropicibacter naphthalenivorans TaxID=441103 RepID=A0A0P1GFV2_9RHOB|nr:AraC family transcriptional regulator [Tropicibacter naphthalenivorans]CUH80706.1 HTH-type transcriptional regulator YesS [Tropicibacter naphthalenivorans]SMC89450.1 transcriptional regulator, AraC family [Tropicibacter naphthalenivorans]
MTQPHVPDPARLAQPTGDPLGEILHLLKLTGTFYCQSRMTAPWGIAIPGFPEVMSFLVVIDGTARLQVGTDAPFEVTKGELVLMTGGAPISLSSDAGARLHTLEELPIRKVTDLYETVEFGGGGAPCSAMYGLVRLDHASSPMLMALLPDVLRIDPWDEEAGSWLQGTLRFIAREAGALRPGGETVITRLADVVVIEAIRRWLAHAPEANTGWLRAARDPQIGRAIVAIHRDPTADWTVEGLAQVAGQSRSAFAARFTALVGKPAMQYLTEWRMNLGRQSLRDTRLPIASIAADLGYQSEPAFNRAFKRVFGIPPGQVRRAAPPG